MALVSFDKNDVVRIQTTFTNTAGTATDPTDVSIVVKPPSGTETTYDYNPGDIVKSSTGIYYLDVTANATGMWVFRWTGTGTVAQIDEGQFYVLLTDLQGSSVLAGYNELREKVFTVVRDSSRNFVTEADVDLWLGEGMDDLSSRLHLSQNTKTDSDSAISGNTIAIPTDFVDLIWLKVDRSGSDNDYVLPVDEELFNYYEESGADLSVTIARSFDGSFELYPTPSGTDYTLRYWSSTSTDLTAFTGTLRTRMVNYARAHAKYKEGEFTAGDRYLELYERGLPAPSDAGRNRPLLPATIRPEFGWFDSSAYRD